MNYNINDIAFEQIKDNYHWGKYGDFKVIIDLGTGYINATHLCGLVHGKGGNKKELFNWKKSNGADELIDELSASLPIGRDDLMVIPVNLPNEIRGTYVHPDLIPHIASWASPKFAVRVSKIVNAHMIREYKESIRIKDDKIDRITEEMHKQTLLIETQSQQIQELLNLNNEIKTQNNEIKSQNDELIAQTSELNDITNDLEILNTETKSQLDAANTNIVTIATKLGIAVQTRVPPMAAGDREILKIYARPVRPNAQVDEFKVVRRQERTLPTAIRTLAREGYIEIVAEIYPTPNSVDIWKRMKDRLQSMTRGKNPQVYRVVGNMFSTRIGGADALSRADIAQLLRDIDNERTNI